MPGIVSKVIGLNHPFKLHAMIKKLFSFLFISCFSFVSLAQLSVQSLAVENLTNPIGVDIVNPRFGWQLVSDKRNTTQTAYELKITLDGKNIWSTGKVNSAQSVFVEYAGPELQSGNKYSWQLQAWDNFGRVSPWSAMASFQMALLKPSDWKATWIQPYTEDSVTRPSPIFRKNFHLDNKKIKSATAYITAHGLYEAYLNGKRIGDAYFTPGWTSYNKRLQYQVYDVTNLLRNGKNAIGVTLGDGWYRGYIGFSGQKNFYGKDISLLMQVNIKFQDGSSDSVITNQYWKYSTGAIQSADIYNGETFDAKKEKKGWLDPDYDDSAWPGVKTASFSNSHLVATYNEPIRMHETFKPKRIFTTPKGEKVIDFGQNLVGWVQIRIKGSTGEKITISHAEVLDKEGNFYTDNLRAAKAQDIYLLTGDKEEMLEPHFTFHGFQFIKVEGISGELNADDFTAVALYSDMKKTGTFISSDPLINQLQHNIEWGQKGNFLDVPTDCPQRDERLGWTGDAQVFSRTASFNMGVNNFFAKWLRDLAADQLQNGIIPFVIPDVLRAPVGSTGWADASTIIPWNIYLAYGDKSVLAQQYPSMKAWVEYMHGQSKDDLWNTGFHFGDWLFYRPDDDNDGRAAVTDKYLIAQCFYAHSTQLLIDAAKVLGKMEDAQAYTALLDKIKVAFHKEYMTGNGRLVSGTQTAYVLALQFDMLPDGLRQQAAARLAENVKGYGYHLTTGFLGTPYLCHVLTRFGYNDLSYKLLLQPTYPSWLYPVKMGATTIWERWDGRKPDSTFQTPGMNSFNHYSYGAIGDWMYRVMVGLDTYEDKPGYKHIRIMPHPGGGFTRAAASLETHYGKLVAEWNTEGGKFILNVEIPVNTNATVLVPAQNASQITEQGKSISSADGMSIGESKNGYISINLGSGKYQFEVSK
jgi:alpha-L-rhamnosidase